jgi:hypothetical protein
MEEGARSNVSVAPTYHGNSVPGLHLPVLCVRKGGLDHLLLRFTSEVKTLRTRQEMFPSTKILSPSVAASHLRDLGKVESGGDRQLSDRKKRDCEHSDGCGGALRRR